MKNSSILTILGVYISDAPVPSWLEPELELKDFRLGSWLFSLQLEIKNWSKVSQIQFSKKTIMKILSIALGAI